MYHREEYIETFKLNMQMLADALLDKSKDIYLSKNREGDPGQLTGVRLYSYRLLQKKDGICPQYVYLLAGSVFQTLPDSQLSQGGGFILYGDCSQQALEKPVNLIRLLAEEDIQEILEIVQDCFDATANWVYRMQDALLHNEDINALCALGYEYFQNPILVHDFQFYILSCPKRTKEMIEWVRDEDTGMYSFPIELINQYKINPEYMGTLETKGPEIFCGTPNGQRVLYMNLWGKDGTYGGRICINELERPLKSGDLLALAYFADLVSFLLFKEKNGEREVFHKFNTVFHAFMGKEPYDIGVLEKYLSYFGWKMKDTYVCIKLDIGKRTIHIRGETQTRLHIEKNIKGSRAFYFEKSIVVFVNMDQASSELSYILTKFSYIIREGLFYMGVSNQYQNFAGSPNAYLQASIALDYGRSSGSTSWCHRFEEHALSYLIDHANGSLPRAFAYCDKLRDLEHYDKKNSGGLLETLKLYLENERNATKTAKELYIHRSTLFYRLEKVQEILDMDLDDYKARLYLQISFQIYDRAKEEKEKEDVTDYLRLED